MGKLYLISGNDEFAIKARSRSIVAALAGSDFEDCSDLEQIRGDTDGVKPETILSDLLAALRTPPFLSSQKIVWLRSFAYFETATAANAAEGLAAMVRELLVLLKDGLPEEVTLVMDGPGIDQRKAFFKAIKAVPNAECEFIRKADLAARDFSESMNSRIQELAREAGKKIEPAAVEYLIAAVGSDTGRLIQEFDKVLAFLSDHADRITLEDCRAVCSRTPEALSWDFSTALAERNAPQALRLVTILTEQMRTQRGGNLELTLAASAAKGFQEILRTRQAAAQLKLPARISPGYFSNISDEIRQANPDNLLLQCHPYRAFKMVERAERYSDRDLLHAFEALLDAHRMLVSGGGDSRIVLEQLILKLTGVKSDG